MKIIFMEHTPMKIEEEKRRLWIDLSAAFQYLKGAYKKAEKGLFVRVCFYFTFIASLDYEFKCFEKCLLNSSLR